MKMVTRIACQNMKYHKGKNILTGIAIFLTTLLLFLVPTIGRDIIQMEFDAINEIYPSWHALYRDVDSDMVKKLAASHEIATYGLRSDAGEIVSKDADISMLYLDEDAMGLYNIKLSEGKLPQKDNEIVVTPGMLQALGQSGGVGDTIEFSYQIATEDGLDYVKQKTFVISGLLEEKAANEEEDLKEEASNETEQASDKETTGKSTTSVQKSYMALISNKFLKAELGEENIRYRFLFQVNTEQGSMTEEIEYTIHGLAEQLGIPEQNVAVNHEYLMANYVDPSILAAIIVLIGIVVFAGAITIYSLYYVGMSDRIQEFGKLKAIGATRKQLRQIVLGEGLAVAAIAIPIGLIVGSTLVRLVFGVILHYTAANSTMSGVMKQLMKEGRVSLYYAPIYMLAILVTLFTVWISLLKPMKLAARVSEIEAMRYRSEDTEGRRARGGRRAKKHEKHSEKVKKYNRRKQYHEMTILRLSKIYLLGNKKNSIITIVSMAITGVFVMVVATVLSCANPKDNADDDVLEQYQISISTENGNKEHPERAWSNMIRNNPLTEDFKSQVEAIDGINRVSKFGSVDVSSKMFGEDTFSVGGVPEEYARELIDGIVEGKATYEELKTGNNIIVDNTLFYWYPNIKVGDTLKVVVEDGEQTKVRALKIIAVGDYSLGFNNYSFMLMAEDGLKKLCPYNTTETFQIRADKAYDGKVEQELQQLIQGETTLAELKVWEASYEEWKSSLSVMSIGCYAFLGILGAICIMNMVNTMIHSLHLRKKEIGMMQAIGMTERQLTRMLQLEGLFYTVGTLIISIGGGSLLGYPVFLWAKKKGLLSISSFHYPVAAACIVTISLLVVQMLLAFYLGKSVKKESLIDRIRYSE